MALCNAYKPEDTFYDVNMDWEGNINRDERSQVQVVVPDNTVDTHMDIQHAKAGIVQTDTIAAVAEEEVVVGAALLLSLL